MYFKENERNSVEVKSVLAICDMLDRFSAFCDEFKAFVQKNGYGIVHLFDRLTNPIDILAAKRSVALREFYKKNKDCIDCITRICNDNGKVHSDLYHFFTTNFDREGNIKSEVLDVYKYLLEHKKDIDLIRMFLNKLVLLKYNTMIFDENLDFTEGDPVFHVRVSGANKFGIANDLIFFENIEFCSYADESEIKYKTSGSRFAIIKHDSFSRILLNSLLIDIDEIPYDVSYENLFELIKSEYDKFAPEESDVHASVLLQSKIDELKGTVSDLENKVLQKFSGETASEISRVIEGLEVQIASLEKIKRDFDKSICVESDITQYALKKAADAKKRKNK